MLTYDRLFMSGELPNPLSQEECIAYFEDYKKGDKDARKKLIEHNIRLVLHVVQTKYYTTQFNEEDLVSEGIMGLMSAIEKYDVSMGTPFSSYAFRCIDNNIKWYIAKCNKNKPCQSLYESYHRDDDETDLLLIDIIEDPDVNIEEQYDEKELLILLRAFLEDLTEEELNLINMHFGFNGRTFEYKEIAEMCDVSTSTIGRRTNTALDKLKKKMVEYGYLDHINRYRRKRKISKGSLYEYFEEFSEEEINGMVRYLADYDINLLKRRFGTDFKTLNPDCHFTISDEVMFLGILKKLRDWLVKSKTPRVKVKRIWKYNGNS